MKRILLPALALFAASALFASHANAAAILYLSDGTNVRTITDGGVGDQNPVVGAVSFVGSFGSWALDVSTGVSKPLLGSVRSPEMDLNTIAIGLGFLDVAFLDDKFSVANMGFRSDIDGNSFNSVGSVTAITGVAKPTPAPFALDSIISFNFIDVPGKIHGTGFGTATLTPTDFLFLGATINHGEMGTTSFDYHTAVPEPGTMMLLGSGLIGLIGFGRRRFTA
ncbi:MAG TPA: PEP-CTERM sorting domain-containing protein [Candidatus Deferrimicrobiaceae bacterium]|jgi:hypothetical protein